MTPLKSLAPAEVFATLNPSLSCSGDMRTLVLTTEFRTETDPLCPKFGTNTDPFCLKFGTDTDPF